MIPILFRRGRRRQIIVDKRFQLTSALTGVVYIVAITLCLFLPFIPIFSTVQALLDGQPSNVVDLAAKQQRMALLTYSLSALWLAVAWVIFSLLRSHKIAGPTYKLTRFLEGIVPGKFEPRVRLRAGDELGSIAAAVNGLMEKLQAHEEQIEQRIERLGRQHGENPVALTRFILDGQDLPPSPRSIRQPHQDPDPAPTR